MRDKPSPAVSFPAQIHGDATLSSEESSAVVALPRYVLSRDEYATSEPWQLAFHVPAAKKPEWRALYGYGRVPPIRFSGRTDDGLEIVLNDWQIVYVSERTAQDGGMNVDAEVYQFDVIDRPAKARATSRRLTVYFTHTPLAARGHKSAHVRLTDGFIWGPAELDSFVIELSVGTLTFGRSQVYNQINAGGEKALVVLERTSLSGDLKPDVCATPSRELLDSLNDELFDLSRVISFLTRRRIEWTNSILVSESDPTGVEVLHRRRQASRAEKADRAIISLQSSPPNAIGTMLARLRSLPYRENLHTIIGMLIAVHEPNRWLEDAVMNAFTAMEALGTTLFEARREKPLIDATFEELRQFLEPQIDTFGQARGWDANVLGRVNAKLHELARPPIVARLAQLFEDHGVEWRDLWRVTGPLMPHLREAYKRRSQLIHSGRISDYDEALKDSARIHALTERLLFRILGGDDSWVDSQAYVYASFR